jgi:hypothetical protein
MKYIKKISIPIYIDNISSEIYYYSTDDSKVQVVEYGIDIWRIVIGYEVNDNFNNGEHILKKGTLKEMLKEGERLYKLILKNE